MHLHDIRPNPAGQKRSHRVIGTGELDWQRYLPLIDRECILDYVIGVRPREKAGESLASLKRLLSSNPGT